MQIDGGVFEIPCPQQHLDSTQIRARFKQMRGKAVAQRVRMHIVRKAGLARSSFASMVDHLGGDGVIAGMTTLAREQPYARFSSQPVPVLPEFVEQPCAEQYIAVFAAFTALDVDHHALAVDVTHFQACEFGTAESGGVERHQQSAMQRRASCIDESRTFFLAEDRWQVKGLLRVGRLGNAPGFLERFHVEESESCKMLRHRVRRELPLVEQRGLIFADVLRAYAT